MGMIHTYKPFLVDVTLTFLASIEFQFQATARDRVQLMKKKINTQSKSFFLFSPLPLLFSHDVVYIPSQGCQYTILKAQF